MGVDFAAKQLPLAKDFQSKIPHLWFTVDTQLSQNWGFWKQNKNLNSAFKDATTTNDKAACLDIVLGA